MATKKTSKSEKIVESYLDLLYMTPSDVRAKDMALLLQGTNGVTIELWDDMNVLEIELPSKNTVDFEPLEVSFKDPSDASFVKNRNIKTIFAIHVCEDDLDTLASYFEPIVDQFSGFLCADSEDFTPVIVGSSKK